MNKDEQDKQDFFSKINGFILFILFIPVKKMGAFESTLLISICLCTISARVQYIHEEDVMKKLLISCLVAALWISLGFSPAAAAGLASGLAYEDCGSTYVVQDLDNLSKIATYCGTRVATILRNNPQIINPDLIYTGQVIFLTGTVWEYRDPITYTSPTYGWGARVSLSTYSAEPGEAVTISASGFPANSEVDYRISQLGKDASLLYDGVMDSAGAGSLTFTIPAEAQKGQSWVVLVKTTSQRVGVDATSAAILIHE